MPIPMTDQPTVIPASDHPITPQKRGRGRGRPFVKGQIANPTGRNKRPKNITDLARRASPEAMRHLIHIMRDRKAPHGVRATCAAHIIERGWGKAPQQSLVTINHNVRVQDLTDAQLLAIIAGMPPEQVLAPQPLMIEGTTNADETAQT